MRLKVENFDPRTTSDIRVLRPLGPSSSKAGQGMIQRRQHSSNVVSIRSGYLLVGRSESRA